LLQSLTVSFPSIKDLRQVLLHLHGGACRTLEGPGYILGGLDEADHIPLAIVTSPTPTRIFEDIPIEWDAYKADTHCVSWVLSSTTDPDVIYSTIQFAADMIWYPEIAGALSPHLLADLFFNYLVDGQIIPSKAEHASLIGMVLASILSTRLTIEPDSWVLRELCERICNHIGWTSSAEPIFKLVADILRSVVDPPANESPLLSLFWSTPDDLSMMQKLWLSGIVLQTI